MNIFHLFLLLGTIVVWGFNFVAIEIGLQGYTTDFPLFCPLSFLPSDPSLLQTAPSTLEKDRHLQPRDVRIPIFVPFLRHALRNFPWNCIDHPSISGFFCHRIRRDLHERKVPLLARSRCNRRFPRNFFGRNAHRPRDLRPGTASGPFRSCDVGSRQHLGQEDGKWERPCPGRVEQPVRRASALLPLFPRRGAPMRSKTASKQFPGSISGPFATPPPYRPFLPLAFGIGCFVSTPFPDSRPLLFWSPL